MIKEIKIKGFECHIDSTLQFVPGTNIITGTSDSGKSSICRAVTWCWENGLRGFGFKSDLTSPSSVVEVTSNFDDGVLKRTRSDKINRYTDFHGKDQHLTALKTGTPDEVLSLTRLSEHNLRAQKEMHFMLDSSPGQRAKMFNEVAGLQKMDEALKEVNTRIRANNAAVTENKGDIETHQKEVDELNWIDGALSCLSELEALDTHMNSIRIQREDLEVAINTVSDCEEAVALFPDDSLLEELESLLLLHIKKEGYRDRHIELSSCISNVQSAEEAVQALSYLDDALESFQKLEKLQEGLNNTTKKWYILEDAVLDVADCETAIISAKCAEDEAQKAFIQKMQELKICPLCEQEIHID